MLQASSFSAFYMRFISLKLILIELNVFNNGLVVSLGMLLFSEHLFNPGVASTY